MTLRDSIAKAKKVFNKTLQSFKGMVSDGYQRLPKAPPCNPFSCGSNFELHHSFRVLNSLDGNFNDQLGDNPDKEMKRKKTMKKNVKEGKLCKENREDPCNGSFMKLVRFDSIELRDHHHHHHHHVRKQEDQNLDKGECNCKVEGEEPSSKTHGYTITQRLKELEKMDVSNVDHLLDIEEILHYYSRITCPFYVDIVNKFFMEMYAEFLPQTLKG